MQDYLHRVGRAGRRFSVAGCTLVSVICLTLSVMLWTDMAGRRSFFYEGRPLWLGAAVVGLIGLAAGFIAWRLLRRSLANNGVTVMPTWFI